MRLGTTVDRGNWLLTNDEFELSLEGWKINVIGVSRFLYYGYFDVLTKVLAGG